MNSGSNKKQEVMDQVRSEIALANAQELINVLFVEFQGLISRK